MLIHIMEKPLAVLKPDLVNALIPIFVRNFSASAVIVITLYAVLKYFLEYSLQTIWLVILLLLMSTLPLTVNIFVLKFTTYYFFSDRIVSQYKLLKVDKHSAPYHKIVNIKVDISIWDRICKAGDIVIHTAENRAADLTLKYIKNPEHVEKGIYNLIQRLKRSHGMA